MEVNIETSKSAERKGLIICYYLFKEMASPRIAQREFRVLRKSWFSYVDSEREKEGMERCLPDGQHTKACCGKSGTSYPHWPPSYRSEATDQLLCLLGRSYPHRLHLADLWMSSLREQAADGRTICLVQQRCPSLQPTCERPQQRRPRMDCVGLCERAIRDNDSICLCCCPIHREECPVHHY